jgi:YjbE family integral membrane protein
VLEFLTGGALFALFQVLMIDIVLAGDNALVIGMAAARVSDRNRHKVIFWGLAIAVVLRISLAVIAVELLQFTPVMLVGGLLLLWVCWRLFEDIRHPHAPPAAVGQGVAAPPAALSHAKAMRRAIVSIAAADVSMSLDNVLAVAAAAMHHIEVLVLGLILSVALMGLAADLIAKLLNRYPWISYAGVAIVFGVALKMIWHGCDRLVAAGWLEPLFALIGA